MALSFLGVAYKWGGASPLEGLDCSGLVQCILASVGMDPRGDQTAHGLWEAFKACEERRGLGALAFYGNLQKVIHVGFCVGERHMVEAGGGGPMVVDAASAIKAQALVRVRPIDSRLDLVGVRMPPYNL